MWHVSSRSGVASSRTAIHLLLTYSRCAVEWIASTWRMRDVRILVGHVCCFLALFPLTAICLWLCTYISGAAVHNSNSSPPVAGPADFNAAAVTTVGLILLLVLLIVFGFLSWCGVHIYISLFARRQHTTNNRKPNTHNYTQLHTCTYKHIHTQLMT